MVIIKIKFFVFFIFNNIIKIRSVGGMIGETVIFLKNNERMHRAFCGAAPAGGSKLGKVEIVCKTRYSAPIVIVNYA